MAGGENQQEIWSQCGFAQDTWLPAEMWCSVPLSTQEIVVNVTHTDR